MFFQAANSSVNKLFVSRKVDFSISVFFLRFFQQWDLSEFNKRKTEMVQKIHAESTTDSSAANPRWIKDFAYACFFLFDFRVCLKLKQITYFFLCCSPEKFSVFFFVLAAPVAHLHLLTFNIFLITAHKYFNLSDKINVRQHLRCLSVLFKSRLFKFSKQKKSKFHLCFTFRS